MAPEKVCQHDAFYSYVQFWKQIASGFSVSSSVNWNDGSGCFSTPTCHQKKPKKHEELERWGKTAAPWFSTHRQVVQKACIRYALQWVHQGISPSASLHLSLSLPPCVSSICHRGMALCVWPRPCGWALVRAFGVLRAKACESRRPWHMESNWEERKTDVLKISI